METTTTLLELVISFKTNGVIMRQRTSSGDVDEYTPEKRKNKCYLLKITIFLKISFVRRIAK